MKRIFTAFMMMLCAVCMASAANYLTFTAEEDGSTFGIVNQRNNPDIQYSLDGGETWTALAAGDTITLAHKGEKALLRGDNPEGFSKDFEISSSFTMTGKIAASGSVMSLIDNTGETLVVPAAACFCRLFEGCTSLTQAPALPATTLAEFCYQYMFNGCTSLTQAPELPATTLDRVCYAGMFQDCTSLTQAPALPATTLAGHCYTNMFISCTSLTQAPELPATTLAESCYFNMFMGCTRLSEINVSFDDWAFDMGTHSWVYGVARTGTFYCPKALALEYGEDRIPEGWTVKYIDDTVAVETNYLTFTAEEDGSTFGIVFEKGALVDDIPYAPDIQYSLDNGGTWTVLADSGTVVLAKKGDKAMLRGNNPDGLSMSWEHYVCFTMTGKIAASGSVMSLIDGKGESTVIRGDGCFYRLFYGCDALTQAPELPATTLTKNCYTSMFNYCKNLKQAPELPALVMAEHCYESMFSSCGLTQMPELQASVLAPYCYCGMFSYCKNMKQALVLPAMRLAKQCYGSMFYGCDSLVQAPELPATTLASFCYSFMFTACKGLTQAPALPALKLVENCYSSMFKDCVGLVQAPELPATTLAPVCYSSMFDGCTKLAQAPELPAMELKRSCYNFMFYGCTSLTQAPELPATALAESCYSNMFSGCTSLTQAPELPATTLARYCYYYMFEGCTGLTQAPELLATTLAESCYSHMFLGCTNLSQIHVSFDDWNDDYFTAAWVKNVAPTGTFYCPKALPLEYGVDRIPEGWTVKFIDDTVAAETNYLTFTAEEDGATFGVVNNEGNNPDIQYSLDGGKTWTALAAGDIITLAHKGDKALLRGDNPEGISKGYSECSSFTMTGKIAASGSVMSLIDGMGKTLVVPAGYCFYALFKGCTSLTQAPELPATTLAEACYLYMFNGCTSLTQAPELPATTLSDGCYAEMFYGCTSLTQAPELPATKLARGCYSHMFSGCTSLTQAPELPATTLAIFCYEYMFSGCTSLTKAPELLATELPDSLFMRSGCCESMFSGCTNLSEISVAFDKWNDNTRNWVKDVAPTGTFYCPKALPLEYGVDRIPEGWTVKFIDDTVAAETNYLTFTAEEDGSSFGIVSNEGNNPDVQYSLDGGKTWTTLAVKDAITLAHKGDKALLRGDNPDGFSRFLSPWTKYTSFTMTGKIAASGSVMSLIDGIGETLVIPNDICFYKLFFGCASLTQAPELPATTLAGSCYEGMFSGCTSLTQAPKLPATTLAKECYWEMFRGCTSLAQAPKLPATTLAGYCYCGMFDGCTGLTEAPELPVTTLAEWCYYGMFSGCTRLTQAPVLPANTLAGYCYNRMFQGCTSLTQAPALPATTLSGCCYSAMFRGCTNLTQAPELPATTLAGGCYSSMFSGCTSLAQAPELPATTMAIHCYENMFYGCTSLTKAPELPATELPDSLFMRGGCCESMFSGCTNLSEISIAFDKWNDNTFEWVKDVAPTGTFICPKDLPLEYGVSRIPEGWTVKYIEGEGSGVNTTLANNITIWTDNLTIYIRGAEGEVSLYDMSGRIVATSNSKDEERALCVPAKGVYVVRTNNGTSDVLVR